MKTALAILGTLMLLGLVGAAGYALIDWTSEPRRNGMVMAGVWLAGLGALVVGSLLVLAWLW